MVGPILIKVIMKAQILKISGHKNEKDFYKEFPTQEAFMAKHGAAFKKAQTGVMMDSNKNGVPDYLENIPDNSWYNNQNFGPQYNPGMNNTSRFPKPAPNTDYFDPSSVIQPYQKTAMDVNNERMAIAGDTPGATDAAAITESVAGDYGTYVQAGIQAIGAGVDAKKNFKNERKNVKSARAWADTSDIVKKSFNTLDIDAPNVRYDNAKRKRNALMPTITGEELFPIYGTGTNPLGQAKSGKQIKKANSGEIMNTYAPGDLYQDLEYEPLQESVYQPLRDEEIVKAYKSGGLVKAQNGKSNYFNSESFQRNAPSWTSFANSASSVTDNMGENGPDAGTELGGNIGQAAGSAVGMYFGGPIGAAALGAVGKWAGGALGGALDTNDDKIKEAKSRMNKNMAEITGIEQLRGDYSAYAEDGGNYKSPQVLKYFGNNSVNELLKPDPMMNTLRTGGNIRSNQVGDIEAVSGGHLEPISFNPYSDGNGVVSMIKGQTHEESNGRHTGVLLNYDKAEHGSNTAQVEAETGEPITEIGDSAVIFGDMVINDRTVGGDPMFKGLYGKTFKKAMAGLAEQNQKLNKQQSKNTNALNDLDVRTPIDKLTLNSLTMNAKGIDNKYALNDAMMKKAAAHQEVVNNEAERLGINSGAFSRGKLAPADNESSYSKNGGIIKAQNGVTKGNPKFKGNIDPNKKYANTTATPGALDYTPIGTGNDNMFSSPEAYAKYKTETEAAYNDPEMAKALVDYFKNYEGEDWQDVRASINKGKTFEEQKAIAQKLATDGLPGRFHINTSDFKTEAPAATPATPTTPAEEKDKNYQVTPYKKTGLETLAGQILPWMRKQPGESLMGDQLAGEMFALSNNQEEPVDARFYHPQLRTPYDISYQDQLNENQADFNQLVNASGNNPEALAALAAQKYGANSKVLAEQFRANQAMKDQVYSGNINTLNEAQLKNLQIADQQYVRQAQAKSATKAVKQEAINSISSKIGQNRLENRTLQVYANMFPDYSYDSQFRIRKTGAPANIDIPVIYNEKGEPTHKIIKDKEGKVIGYEPINPIAETDSNNIIPIPAAGIVPINPTAVKNNTTKTMGTSSSTGPTIIQDKNKKRYGGLAKAFKDL
jgi:hypothetical protein